MFHLESKSMLMKGDEFVIGEGRAELLKLIDEKGSISGAAKEMEMSYRYAWGIVKEIEKVVGDKVIITSRGGEDKGGSRLSDKGKHILEEYEKLMDKQEKHTYRNPALTVDGIVEKDDRILLIKRRNPPFQGMYALPGGFVEYNEPVEKAVVREIEEETGLKTEIEAMVGVYSDPGRDPRGHTVSVVFSLNIKGGKLEGGSDAETAEYFDKTGLPDLAFDHSKIISDYLLSSSD
ncbi:MAG: NUDIX domain-containing protein [Thermoplasmata archaeon]